MSWPGMAVLCGTQVRMAELSDPQVGVVRTMPCSPGIGLAWPGLMWPLLMWLSLMWPRLALPGVGGFYKKRDGVASYSRAEFSVVQGNWLSWARIGLTLRGRALRARVGVVRRSRALRWSGWRDQA